MALTFAQSLCAQTSFTDCDTDSQTLEIYADNRATLADSLQNVELSAIDSKFSETDLIFIEEQLKNAPNKVAAGVLNILLGEIGVGHFYTGQTLRGVLDIVFCWTGVPALIGLVEGIIWLCEDDEAWEERCAKWSNK